MVLTKPKRRIVAMADPPASADENPENIAQENNPPGKEDDEAGKVAAGAETSEAEAEEKASVNEQEFTEDQKASVRRQVATVKQCLW